MKKYKIAFVVNQFPSVSETFILNQITDLIERGHDVKVFSFINKRPSVVHKAFEEFDLAKKTTYFRFPSYKFIRFLFFVVTYAVDLIRDLGFGVFNFVLLRRAFYDYALAISLKHFLIAGKFDLVHAHFGQRGRVVANLLAGGQVDGFKFLVSFHGYDLNPLYVNKYKKDYHNLFKFADIVTVNSKYLQQILLQVCPNPKQLVLLPEGLKTEQYSKVRGISKGLGTSLKILFCGRLVEFKAPDLAVKIMDILINDRGLKNVFLRIIGQGKLNDELTILIKQLRLEQHIALLGSLSQEFVIEEMNRADLFLLPGIHEKATGRAETQGLVVQEAQAMELPVVVSNAGGIPYGVLDGISGFVVQQGNLVAFADKIELLMKDADLRSRMASAGRRYVIENFDTRILGDKLVDVYSALMQNNLKSLVANGCDC